MSRTRSGAYSLPKPRRGRTHFSQPNQNDAIIMPTVRAFQKAFGRDHFYAEVFSGERINPKKTDLVLSSAGTYRRAADIGSRDIG